MSLTPRTYTAYECDHLRPLVRVAGKWCHVTAEGDVGAPCGASSVYPVEATVVGHHHLADLIREEKPPSLEDFAIFRERWDSVKTIGISKTNCTTGETELTTVALGDTVRP